MSSRIVGPTPLGGAELRSVAGPDNQTDCAIATTADDTARPMQPPTQALMQLIAGATVAQAISVVCKLGIADLLRAGPRTCVDMAAAVGAHAPSLYRVLRALAGVGIFAEDQDGGFVLTPLAQPLRSDVPNSVQAYAVMSGERWVWRSLGEIEHSVRTGESAFEHVFGAPLFDYYSAHPEAGQVSANALSSLSRRDNDAVIDAYDFTGARTIIDIGGGQGSLLAAVLVANPGLRGVLFERQPVIEMARTQLNAAGVADRCELVSGDFFATIPAGGDIYIMKKVIHDWNDDDARVILKRAHAAMPASARLLLADHVVPPGNEPSEAKWLDLLMLVYAGGRERTESEHRDLLASAEFAFDRIVPTASSVSLIEARPR